MFLEVILIILVISSFISGILFSFSRKSKFSFKYFGYFQLLSSLLIIFSYLVVNDADWLNESISSLSALLLYVVVLLIPPLFYHFLLLIYDFPTGNFSKNYILPYIVLGINSLSFFYLNFFNVNDGNVFDIIVSVMNYTNFIVAI